MGPMAGAEPSPIVTSLTNRHTAQVCTDSQHDKPLRLLNTVGISLWVTQRFNLDAVGLTYLVGGTVADEHRLATPFDNDLKDVEQINHSLSGVVYTFLPSGIAERSTSTLAIAKTSADADIFCRKS